MAFANVAGRAGFVLDLDKSALDTGLPAAERQFTRSVDNMTASAQKMTASGLYSPQQVNLAQKYGLSDLISQNDELEQKLAATTTASEGLAEGLTKTAGAGQLVTTALSVAKFAGIGLAITTAYQASQRLQDALTTTGQEAFTTEGRLKNMGAALLSSDIIGAFDAWHRQPKNLEELGISATEAGNRIDALSKVADGSAAKIREQAEAATDGRDKWDEYHKIIDEAGTSNQKLAQQLEDQVAHLNAADNATSALADSLAELGTAYTNAAGDAATFKGAADDAAGARGPGAIDQSNAQAAANRATGVYVSRDQRIANALRVAQAQGNTDTVLALQREDERRAQRAYDAAKASNSAASAGQRGALASDLASATAARIATEKQIEADAKSASDKADADAKARRDKADAAAKAAAEKAARDYRTRLDTREQNLRNAYAAALQSPGMRDDQRTFVALRNFLTGEGRDQRLTAGERADYRGEFVTLKGQRQTDMEKADEAADRVIRDRQSLQETRLKNRVAAAELTKKNVRDDLKALRDLRDFYKRARNDKKDIYTAAEQAQFEYDRIGTQAKINDILTGNGKDKPGGGDTAAAYKDFAGFLHYFETQLKSQFTGGTGSGNALQTHALEQFTLQGNRDRAEQTSVLKHIAHRSGGRILDEATFS